jgi:PAS domain S-box-containing protein
MPEDGIVKKTAAPISLAGSQLGEAELAAANAELQLQVGLLQHLPVSAWTLKPDGTPDFVNQVWLEYSGQTLDFVRSHPEAWMTAVHPEDREAASRSFWEGVHSGQEFAFETRSRRARDGTYRWHLNQAVVLRDAEGKVLKFVGTTTDIDDQKRAQEVLRASEGKLRRVIDTIPTLAWCNLADGPNEFLNQRWHAYTGLSPEESHGWGWQVAFHPEDLPPLMKTWQQLLISGESGEIEARLRRHDGAYRWFLIRVAPLRDEEGKIVRWYGTSTDIEDRKRAEDAVLANERNLGLIISTMPVLAWSARADGNVDFFNQRWLDYTGLSLPEARGWGWAKAFHPDDLAIVNEYWRSRIAGGELGEIEARLRRFDGSYRWFLFRANPLRDESGAIVKWYGTNTDIDDRKRAEEKLRASESNLRQVFDSIPGMVFALDPTGKIELSNRRHLEYFGKTLDELNAWAANDAIHPDDLPRAIVDFKHSMTTGSPFDTELRYRRADGVYRWFQGRSLPVRDTDGRIARWYSLITDIDDRKRAEEKLRQEEEELKHSEARKAAILESALDCIVTIDHEGLITEFNPAAERTFGHRRDEVVGKQLADVIIPPSLREKHRDGFARYLATGEARVLGKRIEMTAVRADGSEFPVELAVTRIPLEGPPSFTGYLRDISDRKQVEEALRASESQLRQVVDSIPGLVCTMSLAGEIATLNKQLLEYFGKTPEDLKNWRMTDAVHPDDLPRVVTAFELAIRTGAPYEVEHRCRRADGVYRWFQVRALIVQDKDGQNAGRYVLLTDIDDRKRAEEMLQRSEALLAEVQSVSLTGGFSWHVDTDDFTFSEEAYRIFEFEKDVPVTLDQICSRVHPEDIPLFSERMAVARSAGGDLDYEIRLRMPEGSIKYLHTISHGIRDHEGRLEYIGAIQDITRRRLSEEALSKARSELAHVSRVTTLGALTASIAHEVKQPLSGIITNASTCLRMLATDPPQVEGASETARRMIRDGNRMSEVITRLRALFSKKERTTESVNLNEAVLEVITLSIVELQKNRVMLRRELADNLPLVTGDRVQLQQVILNLLRNGSDAMSTVEDRPRQLVIRTERDQGDRVRLTVQDAGVGFDPQAADRLFDAFYTTKGDGMGIGLSVSRSIIESHHGRLWATLNEGPGAAFSFSIPRSSESLARADGIRDSQPPTMPGPSAA